jgi:hypothetical protein
VRRDRLERSSQMLTQQEPFASLGGETCAAIIREQSIIVEFERERAIAALVKLLPSEEERRRAIQLIEFIAGDMEEMEPATLKCLEEILVALRFPAMPFSAALNELLKDGEPPKQTRTRRAEAKKSA